MKSAPCFSTSKACDIILNPGNNVCTKIPRGCRKTATFVLDTSCFNHPNDFKADDNGSFRHNGTNCEFIEMDDDGEVTRIQDPKVMQPGQYKLSRTYWVHSSTKSYKRRSVTLEDHAGEAWPVTILQYSNTGREEDVKVEPHKNSKKSLQPYYSTATSTKQRITEKAKEPLGPSSIFDELYEEGGGVLENTSFASLPRGVSQVKYQRSKLRDQHAKDTLAELIEKCKESKGEFLHSLQVSPEVRLVITTKAQLAEVVNFCTNPEEFSIFAIDVTYDIGPFFVTTTTYRHLKLHDKESGTHPNFPGPMMIHTDEGSEAFRYFFSTLKGLNRDIENILFVGCDRQKAIVNGLSSELPIAQFLACTKHVQDNIKRKMSSLFIHENVQAEFLMDIFGDRSNKGLIDSNSAEDFDARLLSLKSSWDEREIKVSHKETPQFYSYFLANISVDMKEKMLLPVRRSAGIGDNFYFNNCPESMNSCLKKEIDHQKKAASPGKSSKCSYSEFTDIAKNFVGKYRRNVHRALVGDSPYILAPSYRHLEVCKEAWDQLSKAERISKIALIDECGAKEYYDEHSSPAPSTSQILPNFRCSGLPRIMEETWSKAELILQKEGVTKVQAADGMFVAISTSKPHQPHIVNTVNGSVKCDCEAFKSRDICSHVIAVAHKNGKLQEIIAKWEPNLSSLVQSSIPKAVGKKPGPKRNRFTRTPEQRDVGRLEDPLHHVHAFDKPEPYHLRWLEGSRVTSCYGCGNKFRPSMNDSPPPEPYDVVLCRKQVRAYTPKGSVGLRFTLKPENVFFHLKRSCVEQKNSDGVTAHSLVLSDVDKQNLKKTHKMMLKKEFGVIIL